MTFEPPAAKSNGRDTSYFAKPAAPPAHPSQTARDAGDVLGRGRQLDPGVRQQMGRAFGQSFDDVRIHTDHAGAGFARQHSARAVTVGNHIAFATGEYRPSTLEGDALIAHELAHTIQQESVVGKPAAARVAPERSALDSDATVSAMRAVSAIHAGSGVLARPALRAGGLSLQRCSSSPTLKTSSGQFKVGTYNANDSDPGNDTAKLVGAKIDASFTPNDTVVSNKIAFVQMMKANKGGTPLLFPNETRRATTAAQGDAGWAVDRLAGKKSPIYNQNDAGTSGGHTTFGSRDAAGSVTDAKWDDSINLPRAAGETFETTAATFALDVEHSTYLGGLGWGFDCDTGGKVTKKPLSIVSMGNPAGIQKSALEKWNEQAADPDAAKRNAPVQEKVPVP